MTPQQRRPAEPAPIASASADSDEELAAGAADGDEDLVAEPAEDAATASAEVDFERRSAEVTLGQHGARLDKVLVALAPEFSRSHLQQLIERGHVQLQGVDAETLQPARRLRAGERVTLELVPTDESRAFRPEPLPLQCVFEDEHLIVLDKPAGLVVHPAPGHWSGTLLNALLAHHRAAATLPRAGIVHRLDKDTSGLMVVGKSIAAVTALVRAIAARQVHRRYLALVHGTPAQAQWRIAAPIGRDPRSRVRMAVVAPRSGGREARTDVRVLAVRDGIAALECTLHSGRTHQIRVHLAANGLPLVADTLYGGPPALGLTRQALHARWLDFEHPLTRVALAFTSPLPADLAVAWTQVAGVTMPDR